MLPYRRLLGGVLGAASYDRATPSALTFELPAGMDIFQAKGEVQIMDKKLFDEIEEANFATGSKVALLEQVSIFID